MKVIDAHTHLSGPGSGESTENILNCMNVCQIEKAFIFAPLLNKNSWQLVTHDLKEIQKNNDYCAKICTEKDRMLGFCVLNPGPGIGGGSLAKSVDLMIQEATRCRKKLGLKGVKMVPAGWYPNDPELYRLYRALADLGMYVVFHSGIFIDGKEGSYCRPTFYEGVHHVPGLRAQLAHLSWPWVDECIAVLMMEKFIYGEDRSKWQLMADLSFGSPDEYRLSSMQKAIDTLPDGMLCYASDVFWPMEPDEYIEKYLLPHFGLFEAAVTDSHHAPEGSVKRRDLREKIFYGNALRHWNNATKKK